MSHAPQRWTKLDWKQNVQSWWGCSKGQCMHSPHDHTNRVHANAQHLFLWENEGKSPTATWHFSAIVHPFARQWLCHNINIHLWEESKGRNIIHSIALVSRSDGAIAYPGPKLNQLLRILVQWQGCRERDMISLLVPNSLLLNMLCSNMLYLNIRKFILHLQ